MGFFDRFYYGKAGQADFSPEDLPKNRRELFTQMFRIRLSGLVTYNLVYLLFLLPAIVVSYLLVTVLIGTINEYLAGTDLGLELMRGTIQLIIIYLAVMIPCMGLAGIGSTGVMYIFRNWARDQHAFGLSDLKDSIKANWKSGLVFGLLTGLIDLVCFVGWYFYRTQAAYAGGGMSILYYLLEGLMIVIPCVWWMINMLAYDMMITYDLKLRNVIRNSAILVIAKLPKSVGIWLLSLLPTIICFTVFYAIGTGWAVLAWILIYLLMGFSFAGFLYASYANALFDEYLNPRIEGAPINMGLRSAEYDYDENEDVSDFDAAPGYKPGAAGQKLSTSFGEAWPPRIDTGAAQNTGESWLDKQAERGMNSGAKSPTPDAAAAPEAEKPSEDKTGDGAQ